jgi:uroporphyrinogen-III synthase
MAADPLLAGRRVVLTRPETGRLGERLTEMGAVVHHVPLIEIGPPVDDGAALFAELDRLDSYDWVVVTSPNGARQVAAAAGRCPGVRVAAVGATTAATVEAVTGRPVDLVPAVANTDGLLDAFDRQPARVLLALGNLAGDRLARGLGALGHDVVAAEAYATVLRPPSPPELDVIRRADAIVLASGSAVSAWTAADPHLDTDASIITIGPKTAAAARAAGLHVAAVAEVPADDAVIAALASIA